MLLHVSEPTEITEQYAQLAVYTSNTHYPYVRISAKCGIVYAQDVEIDIRVTPDVLICKGCVVVIHTHHVGHTFSVRKCTLMGNCAIVCADIKIHKSLLIGNIGCRAMRSCISDNQYKGVFECGVREYTHPYTPINTSAFETITHLYLTNTYTHTTLDTSHIPTLKYININQSRFYAVNTGTALMVSAKKCNALTLTAPVAIYVNAKNTKLTLEHAPCLKMLVLSRTDHIMHAIYKHITTHAFDTSASADSFFALMKNTVTMKLAIPSIAARLMPPTTNPIAIPRITESRSCSARAADI